jgi:hypothetical protein
MRFVRPLLVLAVVFLCLACPIFLSAQQPVPATPAPLPQAGQVTAFLLQALTTLTGGNPITDVTLTGSATVTRSPNTQPGTLPVTQSGAVILTAIGGESSQVTINLPSGQTTSIQAVSAGVPSLTTSAGAGSQTAPASTALTPHPSWFYPELLLASALSSASDYAVADVGSETRNGAAVEHVVVWLQPKGSSAVAPAMQQATRNDLYLDSTTLLPIALTASRHPFDPTNPNRIIFPYKQNSSDALEEVLYSDYQVVQGRPVAFHIQVYLTPNLGKSVLIADIQLSSANFNTGVAIAAN